MNYERIQNRIRTLIEEAERKPGGKVDAALEPLREALLEARRKGVRLRQLYEEVKAEGGNISPSSFAKYAQRHLQIKKQPGKHRPFPIPKQEKGTTKEKPEQPIPQAGKPRIATGNY